MDKRLNHKVKNDELIFTNVNDYSISVAYLLASQFAGSVQVKEDKIVYYNGAGDYEYLLAKVLN